MVFQTYEEVYFPRDDEEIPIYTAFPAQNFHSPIARSSLPGLNSMIVEVSAGHDTISFDDMVTALGDVEVPAGPFRDQNQVFNFQAPSFPFLFGQGSQTGDLFLGPPVTTYSPPLSSNYPLYSLNFPNYASAQNQFTVTHFRAPEKDSYRLYLWSYDDGSASNTEPQMVTPPKKGNNPNGRKGMYRCETCRKDKKKCQYTSSATACKLCIAKGLEQFCVLTLPPKSSVYMNMGQSC